MSTGLDPREARDLADAKRSNMECCAHCLFMAILTGPSAAPYVPENGDYVPSIFCRANPPIAVPTKQNVLGVFPPVRPGGWCGRYETWRSLSLDRRAG